MGKLKKLSGLQVCKILEKHDFSQVRQKGSHIVMQLKKQGSTITVNRSRSQRTQDRDFNVRYSAEPIGSIGL